MFLETMLLLASEPHQEPENEKSLLLFAVLRSVTVRYSPEHTSFNSNPYTYHSNRQRKQNQWDLKFQIV
jgi:hypothetical protein